MASNSKIKRQRLFDLLTTNLQLHCPDIGKTFLCPLCYKRFDEAALVGSPPPLSLAHIIPEAINGKTCTLTCRKCNSYVGGHFDGELAREQNAYSFLRGDGKVAGTINLPEDRVPVVIERSRSGTHFRVQHITPEARRDFNKQLQHEGEFHFSFSIASRNRRDASLMHSAYLLMFHYFGYEYILSDAGRFVLSLIWSSDCVRPIGQVPASQLGADRPDAFVTLVHSPDELRCFLVILPSSTHETFRRAIALPGFSADCVKNIQRMEPREQRVSDLQMRILRLPNAQQLIDQRYVSFLHSAWNSSLTKCNET